MSDEEKKVEEFKEGNERKGGMNNDPDVARPEEDPKPQKAIEEKTEDTNIVTKAPVKKMKYRRDNKPIRVDFLIHEDNGNITVFEDNDKDIPQKTMLHEEYFTFVKPHFSLFQYIKGQIMTSNQLLGVSFNAALLGSLRLKYLLKECSFVDLEFGIDMNDFTYVSNIDEITGEDGIHESILDFMVKKMGEILLSGI